MNKLIDKPLGGCVDATVSGFMARHGETWVDGPMHSEVLVQR